MSGPPEPGDEAFRWLGQATEDLDTARHIQGNPELPARMPCFPAHLAAEKSLKALLIRARMPFPKSHDLVRLYELLPSDRGPELELADLELLNPWAVDGCCTAHTADASHALATELVSKAGRILLAVQEYLEAVTAAD
ncbi:MAG: HEPN domain-containing protein [Egibacteraceae bacterium]